MNEYTRVFKAFSDPKRVRILELLCRSEECACVLLDDLQISQPTLSHHMKILCESGIVTGRKDGRWMYYRINEDGCEYASKLLNNVKEHKLEGLVDKFARFYGLFGLPKIKARAEADGAAVGADRVAAACGCCCCNSKED